MAWKVRGACPGGAVRLEVLGTAALWTHFSYRPLIFTYQIILPFPQCFTIVNVWCICSTWMLQPRKCTEESSEWGPWGTQSAVQLEITSSLCSSPFPPTQLHTPQNIIFQLRASIKNRFVLINLKSKLFKGSFSGRVYEKSEKGPKASSTGKTFSRGGSSQCRKEGECGPLSVNSGSQKILWTLLFLEHSGFIQQKEPIPSLWIDNLSPGESENKR